MASIPGLWKEVVLFLDVRAGEVAWVKTGPCTGLDGSGPNLTARQTPRRGSGIRARITWTAGRNTGPVAGAGRTGVPGLPAARPRGGSGTRDWAGWVR